MLGSWTHDTARARIVFDVAARLFSQIVQEMRSKFLSRVLFLYDSSVHVLSLHVCRSENVFRERQGIIYELGHCFFTFGIDAFAWMASSSYTAMLLIGYLISVVSFKSAPSSSSSSEENNTHSNLPKIATFFFITFVLLHFVGVPMWKDYTGPLLRSHGSIGFTTSLPMLASVTHSAAFACGLAFVWYRKFGSVRGVSLLVMYDEN